jgi:hypothetical protein
MLEIEIKDKWLISKWDKKRFELLPQHKEKRT